MAQVGQDKTTGWFSGRFREYAVIIIVVGLFITVSLLSLSSMHHMQGNARVVNYVGIVRGATQKLVKEELMGYPDDALIQRLDGIVNELITGEGPNGLIALPDTDFMGNMNLVKQQWGQIKEQIGAVRRGEDPQLLYNLSQDYFTLVDKTVTSAEWYSEKQVDRSTGILLGVNIVFVIFVIAGIVSFVHTAALRRRAEALDRIAYVDRLTQLENRAACERLVERYRKEPPKDDVAVFMFDMNNLKVVNDRKGHQEGDRLIADFARVIQEGSEGLGFVGRYGGDEFLAIFDHATPELAERYLAGLNEKVVAYNLMHTDESDKISFAVGYCIGRADEAGIDEMVNEADRRMYERKRQMKESRNEEP